MPPAAQKAQAAQRFRMDRTVTGGVTLLTLHGVLDEGFDGKKLAESSHTKKVVMNLRDVRRFASWGMAEWMNFLRANPETDLYLIECSTYSVNQINLVTGLLGHGKLVSFYAPYRCASCDEEFESLILVPEDREAIRELADSEQPCPACGGSARMEKYPTQMCAAILERPAFDIDDEVVAFLRSKLKYNLLPDLSRFRAFKKTEKDATYIRMSGSLARLQSSLLVQAVEGTTVLDLTGVTFAPHELVEWRTFVETALPKVNAMQLIDVPPGFLDRGVKSEDFQRKLKIRTFALAYHCPSCNTTTTGIVDVAPNLEQLADGAIPRGTCPTCHLELMASTTPDELAMMRQLPAREHDAVLDKFIAKMRAEPVDKLDDALVVRPAKPAAKPGTSRAMYLVSGLTALLVAGLGLVAFILYNQHKETPQPNQNDPNHDNIVVPPKPTPPQFKRPDWILTELPASAFCQDAVNRLMCIGVSSYRPNRTEAVAEANDAALEELVDSIGLKINDGYFKENVLPLYSKERNKELAALQTADVDRKSKAYAVANEAVRKARHRVVDAFQSSGGAAVPSQRSDWYWEEYAADKGQTEFLVFVRYDITNDAVKALVYKYTQVTSSGSTTMLTAFPSLGWPMQDFNGGAMLAHVGSSLSGVKGTRPVVMAVGDQHVNDAPSFAKMLEEWKSGALKLTVKAGDAPAQVVEVKK